MSVYDYPEIVNTTLLFGYYFGNYTILLNYFLFSIKLITHYYSVITDL